MIPDAAQLGAQLRSAKTIAVIGLSPNPRRPSNAVASYLQEAGYRIVPVRPGGAVILGEPSWPDLATAAAAAGPFDVINIFRRSDALAELTDALVAAKPTLVWMQVGVRDDAVAAHLEAAGITVVMDRCLMVEHPWLVRQ
jgi:predicted CoA-binding protein